MLRFDRAYGALGGEGPIPYVALSRYAEDVGLEGEDRRQFVRMMRVLDGVHLELAAARRPQRRR